MPKVRLLVAWGEHAAGQELDVSDEDFAALRADGKAADVAAEQAQAAQPGNYSARTAREDTTSTKPSREKKA
jgi:hypothetical protein